MTPRDIKIEDEFGDELEVDFHPDATVELSVMSDRSGEREQKYVGGVVLDYVNVERLHRQLGKYLSERQVSA